MMPLHSNGENEEDPEGEVSIEDVVDCRIVLLRSVPIELDLCSDDETETDNDNYDGMTTNTCKNLNAEGISRYNVQTDGKNTEEVSISIGSGSALKEGKVEDASPRIGEEKKDGSREGYPSDNVGIEERARRGRSSNSPPAPFVTNEQQQLKLSMMNDEQSPTTKDTTEVKNSEGREEVQIHPNEIDKAKEKATTDESSSSTDDVKHCSPEILLESKRTQKTHFNIDEGSQERATKTVGGDTSVIEVMDDSDLDEEVIPHNTMHESQNGESSRLERTSTSSRREKIVEALAPLVGPTHCNGNFKEENVPIGDDTMHYVDFNEKQTKEKKLNDITEKCKPVQTHDDGVIEVIDDSDSELVESRSTAPNLSCDDEKVSSSAQNNSSLKYEIAEGDESLKNATNGGKGDKGCPSSKFIEILDNADDESDDDIEIIGVNKAACRKEGDNDNDEVISKSSDQIEYEDRFGVEGEENEDANRNSNDIEIMGVFVSEDVRLNLERKMRQAAKKRKDKVMNNHGIESNLSDPWTRLPSLSSVVGEKMKRQINTKASKMDNVTGRGMKSNVSNPWTYRPPPFYSGVEMGKKRNRTHNPPSPPKKSKVYPKKNIYNYNRDEDQARREQERLFRESAARVKAREQVQRTLNMSQGRGSSMRTYTEVVMDVSTLPKDHFKWSCLYSRLGVPQNSSFSIVKKNYRKLCLLYHPDKARCDDAPTKFQAIKEAYETIMSETNT